MWEETLVFTVHMPELALVRFLVWDHDPIGQDFIGQRTIAFNSMMPGGTKELLSPPHPHVSAFHFKAHVSNLKTELLNFLNITYAVYYVVQTSLCFLKSKQLSIK